MKRYHQSAWFQFALPRGERRLAKAGRTDLTGFQFALPRGERRLDYYYPLADDAVSIRAPARGATCKPRPDTRKYCVSIRAPARGATRCRRISALRGRVSIRAPARGATRRARAGHPSGAVSIRAPARGATRGRRRRRRRHLRFNSRSREGSDFLRRRAITRRCQFQFALPRGERPCVPT